MTPSRRVLYIRDLLQELVKRDIKLRYKRSVLGIGWSLLNPLAQLLVYSIVFGNLLPQTIENYIVFLFVGILVWDWFNHSVMSATKTIVGNRELLKRPGFPAPILPLISVTTNLINFLFALPILIGVILFERTPITFAILFIPFLMVLQFTFTIGLSYLLATLHVIFRDTEYLLGIFLTLVFFMTGIFYDPAPLIEKVPILEYNPMLYLIEAYRTVLLEGKLPDLVPLGILTIISAALLWIGYYTFTNASYKYVEEL